MKLRQGVGVAIGGISFLFSLSAYASSPIATSVEKIVLLLFIILMSVPVFLLIRNIFDTFVRVRLAKKNISRINEEIRELVDRL